jgi:TolB protein
MNDDDSPSIMAVALVVIGVVLLTLALIAVLVGGVFAFVLTPAPAPATPAAPASDSTPAQSQRLAVVDQEQLYIIDVDGGQHRALAHSGAVPTAALIWSRDGERLIFISTERGGSSVRSIRAGGAPGSGGDERLLFEVERQREPFYLAGSPDDQNVAFLLPAVGGAFDLQVVQTDPPYAAQVVVAGQPNYLSWSPDSRSVVVHLNGVAPDGFVSTYRLADHYAERLENSPALFQAPAWSPTGDARLYARQGSAHNELLLNRPDGATVLAEFHGGIAFSWSPDGQRVAYMLNGPEDFLYHQLTVVDLAAAAPVSTTYFRANNLFAFFWSPDGRQLAYLTGAIADPSPTGRAGGLAAPARPAPRRQRTLYATWHVLDLATGRSRELNTFEPSNGFLYVVQYFDQFAQSIALWSPDSRYLAHTGQPLFGQPGVYVTDTRAPGSEPRYLGPGDFATWPWR